MKFKEGDYILLPEEQYWYSDMRKKYAPSLNSLQKEEMYDLLEPDEAWRILYAQSLTIGVVQVITTIRSFDGVYKITTNFTYTNDASGKVEPFEFFTTGGTYHTDLKILTLAEVREYKLNKLIEL